MPESAARRSESKRTYSPALTATVMPPLSAVFSISRTASAARPIVRNGLEKDPLHESFPVVVETVELPKGVEHGPSAFWRCVYDTVRTAAQFPIQIDDSIEAVKFASLMKKTSPFGK